MLNADLIRFSAFSAVLVVMALRESVAPRRIRSASRTTRWAGNLGVAALNTVAVRILFPIAALGLALVAETRGFGLFNEIKPFRWCAIILSVALLDLVIYLQHVMFHAVPLLWRVHRMHHAAYRAQAAAGHDTMTIGIEQFRDLHELRLDRMLSQPFRGRVGDYPISHTGLDAESLTKASR